MPAASPSVARNSLFRFSAEAAYAVFTLLTAIIVARHLGPTLKGTVSTLSYLVALFQNACGIGLGEAAITLVGQRNASLQRATSATIGLLAMSTLTGAVGLAGAAILTVGSLWHQIIFPIAITAMTVPVATLVSVLTLMVESRQRILFTSSVRVAVAATTTVATFVLVDILARWTVGAMAAIAVGWLLGLVLLLQGLRRMGIRLRPTWDPSYLRSALRYGVSVQISSLLIVASARLDLLLVNGIAGRSAAGQYSISLTAGTLATYGPIALMVAAYPRLASLPPGSVATYTARVFRSALAAVLLTTAALAAIVPFATAALFGKGFTPSIGPSLILLAGGLPWAGQWVLCRSWAARGDTGLLVRSFAPSLVAMVALDAALIPDFGAQGAAWAYSLSSLFGLCIAIVGHRQSAGPGARITELIPRVADFRALFRLPQSVLGRARSAQPGMQ